MNRSLMPLVAVAATLLIVLAVVLTLVLTGGDDETDSTPGGGQIEGLVVTPDADLTANHANDGERVDYPDTGLPPVGGNHSNIWQACQAYDGPIASENAVHSLEHGAVWLTYSPELSAEGRASLAAFADERSYVMVSAFPGQTSPVAATAWGRQITAQDASDPRVREFINLYAQGPQTPEPGATCESPVASTGTTPFYVDLETRDLLLSSSDQTVPANGPIS